MVLKLSGFKHIPSNLPLIVFQESGVVIDMSMKQPFLELNRILEALRMQDLGPALEYVICLNVYYFLISLFIISPSICFKKRLKYSSEFEHN